MSTLNNPLRRRGVSSGEMIEEAIRLAKETGWHGITVRALAKRLGYAAPVLYEHFKSKEHLLRCVIRHGFQSLDAEIQAAIDATPDPEDKLVQMALVRMRFAARNTALNHLMFATNCPCDQQELVIEGMCTARHTLQQLIAQVKGNHEDARELATQFIAMVRGYAFLAHELPNHLAHNPFFEAHPPEAALERAVIRFIQSIRP